MSHLTVQQLSSSLDGALVGPSLELVVRHLAGCHDCRDRQARLARHDDALRRMLAQDPTGPFLEDLSLRAEEIVVAIARGLPVPPMSTSAPLREDEDPGAPAEPPSPARPELGRAGQLAQEAGFGRIGMKPTGSTRAPLADPIEAQRLLDALASGNFDDLTELTAEGMREHTALDGPQFDLPAWIKESNPQPRPSASMPREVQKLEVFFEQLDERAAGITREAVDEVFRRPDPPATPVAPAEPVRTAAPMAWGAAGFEIVTPGQGTPRAPILAALDRYSRDDAPAAPRVVQRRRKRMPWLLALGTVGSLLLLVVALRLMPVPAPRAGAARGVASRGFRFPRVQFTRQDSSAVPARPASGSALRSASLPPSVETRLPAPPMPQPGTVDSNALATAAAAADSLAALQPR